MTENDQQSESATEASTGPEPLSAEQACKYCQWKLAGLLWEHGASAGQEADGKAAGAFLEKSGGAIIEKVIQGKLTSASTFHEFECSFGNWLYKEVLPDLILQLDAAEYSELIRFRDYCTRNLAGVLYRCMEYTGERERAEVDWECAARCVSRSIEAVGWFLEKYGRRIHTQQEFDEECGKDIFYGIYWSVKYDFKKGLTPYARILFG
jgi:hypothetical protein